MSTETNASRLPVTAILAKVILLRHSKQLPEPKGIDTTEPSVRIELASLADLHVWIKTFGGKRSDVETLRFTRTEETRHSYAAFQWDDSGWWYSLYADVPHGLTESPLDPETVAALEAVAEKPEIPGKRVDEIVEQLNSFRVYEYEGGSEMRGFRCVPVREAVGCDFNRDKAIKWALTQPEVSATGDEEVPFVSLRDGTQIEWIDDEKQWSVVCDLDENEVAP